MKLADLISQLEATKFLRLFRYLIDEVENPDFRDNLRVPAAPAGLNDVELVVKKVGHRGSMNSFLLSWIFQIVHLPTGLWDSAAVESFLDQNLERAFQALRTHPDAAGLLRGELVDHEDADAWGSASNCDYYLFTNIMHEIADEAVERLSRRAADLFEQALPGQSHPRFGMATPETISSTAAGQVETFILDLLREPSGYQCIAREGKLSVVPFTEHGAYVSSNNASGGRLASLAVATSTLKTWQGIAPARLAELEALMNDPRTCEADLQHFLERHPAFLFALDGRYCEARAHVCLTDPGGQRLVPDFLARIEGSEVWDAIELKLPRHSMLAERHGKKAMSAQTAHALAQVMTYRDFFVSPANRQRAAPMFNGTVPFEPCLVVVIGRGGSTVRYDWRSLRPGFPGATIVSYDYLLERARACSFQLNASQPVDPTRYNDLSDIRSRAQR